MSNNGVKSHSMIVRSAPVNDPNEIFVCLQKDAKQSIIIRTAQLNDHSKILQKDA